MGHQEPEDGDHQGQGQAGRGAIPGATTIDAKSIDIDTLPWTSVTQRRPAHQAAATTTLRNPGAPDLRHYG